MQCDFLVLQPAMVGGHPPEDEPNNPDSGL